MILFVTYVITPLRYYIDDTMLTLLRLYLDYYWLRLPCRLRHSFIAAATPLFSPFMPCAAFRYYAMLMRVAIARYSARYGGGA